MEGEDRVSSDVKMELLPVRLPLVLVSKYPVPIAPDLEDSVVGTLLETSKMPLPTHCPGALG